MLKNFKLLGAILLVSPLLSHATPTSYNDGRDDIEYAEELKRYPAIEDAADIVVLSNDKPAQLSPEDSLTLRNAASLFFTPDDHLITASPFATLYLYLFDKEDLKITQDSPIAEVLGGLKAYEANKFKAHEANDPEAYEAAEPEAYEAKVELVLLHHLFRRMQVRNLEIDFSCFPLEYHEKFLTTIMENTFTENRKFYNYLT